MRQKEIGFKHKGDIDETNEVQMKQKGVAVTKIRLDYDTRKLQMKRRATDETERIKPRNTKGDVKISEPE